MKAMQVRRAGGDGQTLGRQAYSACSLVGAPAAAARSLGRRRACPKTRPGGLRVAELFMLHCLKPIVGSCMEKAGWAAIGW